MSRATSSYIASQCGCVASGPQFRAGRDNLQIHRAHAIVGANYLARTRRSSAVARHLVAGQESRQLFDWIQRRRQSNSIRPRIPATRHEALKPLERQGEMRTALVARQRVEFIDNHVANAGELLAEPGRSQQDEQRLGRRDQNMRRPPEHRSALAGGRVAGAQAGADAREIEPGFRASITHALQRLFEIQPDVVGERLERGDIQHRNLIAEPVAGRVEHQAIDRPHERGERLAAARRRAQQDVEARRVVGGADHGPSKFLSARGRREAPLEPTANRRMEIVERGGHAGNIITGAGSRRT
jgi:hypothetical protein